MKIIELHLGNFEELKFAKRIFKQDLRTRKISASFVENAAASEQGLWEGSEFSTSLFPWSLARN